jgi:hypothetical protein
MHANGAQASVFASAGTPVANARGKLAARFVGPLTGFAVNSNNVVSSIVTATQNITPDIPAMKRLNIGHNEIGGLSIMNGYIERVALHKSAVDDTTLLAMVA